MSRVIIITGTGTGVGKTVLTALLASHLRASGRNVAALKPICSGGRDDARKLRRALGRALTLDEINLWHFRAPLAPLLAARREYRRVTLREVVAQVRAVSNRFETVLIEGAGGLLSPLGEDFSTRELIAALEPEVFIVARNELGAVNQVRLTLEALPSRSAAHARVVMMSPERKDAAARANPDLLAEFAGAARVFVLPWFRDAADYENMLATSRVRRALAAMLDRSH